ncbi:ABC transporter permease [Bdellovibrio sp. NC01]|uniref:ABC transporter permease n=1 Tax=Bdellovibrio sp. NC01 TaxID=2220073 RepID=UPI0011581D1E|nr:ABC transporter permease [Bdellovibrio sp. NC01]QDK38010.1 hypothetical protein DOE51_10630 [Bdellovibrio sp. NC01]
MTASSLYAQDFGNLQIAMASVLILIAISISKFLKFDLEKDFFIAGLRTTIQLIAVGFVLRWILKGESALLNVLVLLFMTLVAAQAVVSRLKHKSLKMYGVAFVALLGSAWPLGYLSLEVFFHQIALQQASFFVPYMGVLMGNALSAISLALVNLERVRAENILEIETFKSLGANHFEAAHRVYRDLLRTSLTPTINGMTIVGLVSLPGVMAGQLIGGVDPLTAARFQILVMFLILLTSMVGTLIALFMNHYFFMPKWLTAHVPTWSFLQPPQEKLILSGPSGSGKSRLLKSMTGLDLSEIREEQKNKTNIMFQDSSEVIHYIHQKAHFIPGTVEENLRYPYSFHSHKNQAFDLEKAKHLLREFGLNDSILAKNATTLSGGEAQLVHLVRSLQLNPQILFLDEPSSSLDPERTRLLEAYLNNWIRENNHRLVMITHNQEQLRRFGSRVALLKPEGLAYE